MIDFQAVASFLTVNDGASTKSEKSFIISADDIYDASKRALTHVYGDDVVSLSVIVSAPKPQ